MQKHLYRVLANANYNFSTDFKNIDLYYLNRNIKQENRLARNLLRFLKIAIRKFMLSSPKPLD